MKQHIFYYSTALERGLISILELSRSVGTLEVSQQKKGNKNNNIQVFNIPGFFSYVFTVFIELFREVGSIDFSSFFLRVFPSLHPGFQHSFHRSVISQDQLQISGQRPSLMAFRQQCRDAARRLEQLVVDGGSLGVAASTVDPSALLAEARRRDLGWNHGGGDNKTIAKDI